MSKDLKELEGKIGYKFDDFTLFTKAMIHSSYANEKHLPKYECNERLEFLGDAVLELVSSEFLFHNNPKLPEGELTKTRASMVCEPALAFCARDLDLGEYLLLGKGEDPRTVSARQIKIGKPQIDRNSSALFFFPAVCISSGQCFDQCRLTMINVSGRSDNNILHSLLSHLPFFFFFLSK